MTSIFRPERGRNENFGTIMFGIWLVFMAVFILAYYFSLAMDAIFGDAIWQQLVVAFSGSVPVLLLSLVVPVVYGRRVLTLVTYASRFRFKLFLMGSGVWGILLIVSAAISWVLDPTSFRWSFDASSFFPLLAISCVAIPVQVASEELLYRGVIPQALGRAFRSDFLVIIFTTLLFALPHLLNPEAKDRPALALITYSAISLSWVVAVWKWGGLEISLGAHLINNVFGILIVGYENSVVRTSPIWMTPAPDMALTAISSVITCAVWFVALHYIAKKWPKLQESHH